ncbi:MAG: hypothetical protein OXU61_01220 [Gammaproteobacteria bacterium]|nr:hypothetical protein [Gammaproteobacteria bacterium]
MPTQTIPVNDLDKAGLIGDIPAVNLPPNAFSDANNVRFKDGAVRKILGHQEIFSGITSASEVESILHIEYWPNPNGGTYIVVTRQTADAAMADVWTVTPGTNGEATNVKRTVDSTGADRPMMTSIEARWQVTVFNGGYSAIVNNGLETPRHMTDQQGSDGSNLFLDDLPGWASYATGTDPVEIDLAGVTISDATNAVFDYSATTVSTETEGRLGQIGIGYVLTVAGIDATFNGAYTVTAIDRTAQTITTSRDTSAASGDHTGVDGNTVTANPMVDVVTAGTIVSFGNVLMAGNLIERNSAGDVIRDLRGVVRSSDVAAPGSIPTNWDPFQTAVNTADEILIADTGQITAMVQLQGNMYVYTANSINQLRISANGLAESPITQTYGALGRDTVFEFDGTHIVIGSDDIYVFPGHPGSIKSIADGRVRRRFYEDAHYLYQDRANIVRNNAYDELWISYASVASGDGEYDRVLIWNYRNNTFTYRDLPEARSITVGPVQGGGISSVFISFDGTGNTGQFGLVDAGTREVQTLTVTDTARAAHDGILHEQEALFAVPTATLDFENRETFDLVIDNEAGATAAPALVHAVNTITFPSFTPQRNSAIAGGTRVSWTETRYVPDTTDNDGVAAEMSTITIDGSQLSNYTTAENYVEAIRTAINADSVGGLEDYTASGSGLVLVLTSDVQGRREFSSATLQTFTGTTVPITGTAPSTQTEINANGVTVTAVSNPANGTYSAFDTGTVTSGGAGGITASVTNDGTFSTRSVTRRTVTGGNPQGVIPGWVSVDGAGDRGDTSIRQINIQSDTVYARLVYSGGFSAGPNGTMVRGPAYRSGDTATDRRGRTVDISGWPQLSAGQSIFISWRGGGVSRGEINHGQQVSSSSTRRSISFTNTNDYRVALNSNSTGGARTLQPRQTVDVQDGDTSNSAYRIASNGGNQVVPGFDGTTSPTGGVTASVTDDGTYTVFGPRSPAQGVSGNNWPLLGSVNGRVPQSGTITVSSDTAAILVTAASATNSGDRASASWTIGPLSGTAQISQSTFIIRGPAYQSGDNVVFGAVREEGSLAAGTYTFSVTGTSTNGSMSLRERTRSVVTNTRRRIDFTNTNAYPVVLNSNSTGGARTINAGVTVRVQSGDTTNSAYRIAANDFTIQLGTVTWTAAVNRPSSMFPLQEDVQDIVVTAGGSNIRIGDVANGASASATSAGGEISTTGTWAGSVFGTSTVNVNQQTANSSSLQEIGPINITRRSGDSLAGADVSGGVTSSTDVGQFTVSSTARSSSTTASISSGTASPGSGNGGYQLNSNWNNGATRLAFPANTVVDASIAYRYQTTGIQWTYLGAQREWRINHNAGTATITIGGQTYRTGTQGGQVRYQPDNGQSFYAGNTGVAGVYGNRAHSLYWSETAGSGLNIQLNGSNAPEYNGPGAPNLPTGNSQALLNNANRYPQLFDSQRAINNDFNFPSNPVDGQVFSVPARDESGTIRIHGTTGNSGSTIRMFFGSVISNGYRSGWAPRNIGSVAGTRTTYDIAATLSSTAPLNISTSAASPSGIGGTYTPGQTRTVTGQSSANWRLAYSAIPRYDYDFSVDADSGDATITHADGDITDVTLTTSAQELVTNTVNSTINVQGTYLSVSGTATNESAPTPAVTTTGNGVYGIADADAPNVRLRITHTGTGAFNVAIPEFEDGDDTSAEYRQHLLDTLPTITEFSGVDPLTVNPVQPSGAVFHVADSPTANAVRFTNVSADDHDPVTISALTSFNGVEYPESQFGGNLMETVTTVAEGGGGGIPPIVRYDHSLGSVEIAYYGDYSADATGQAALADSTASAINTLSGFTSTSNGGTVTVTRTQPTEENEEFTSTAVSNVPADFTLLNFTQTREGVIPSEVEPVLTVTSPDSRTYTVDLDGLGTRNGEITSAQIAGAIRAQVVADSDWTTEDVIWDISGSGAAVTFTSNTDPSIQIPNGNLPAETLVAGTTPGYTGQTLGRSVDGVWSWTVANIGDTGTNDPDEGGTANQLALSRNWPETTAGVNPRYSRDGSFTLRPQSGDPVVVELDSLTADGVGIAIQNHFLTDARYNATYSVTMNQLSIFVTDLSSDAPSRISSATLDPGTYLADGSDSTVTQMTTLVTTNDPERPWPASLINESRNFPVFATAMNTFAADLSYSFNNVPFTSYIERTHFHAVPTKDTEMITEFHLHAEGDAPTLTVPIMVTNTLVEPVDLTNIVPDQGETTYTFNLNGDEPDYKVDVRKTGRFFNYRIENTSSNNWELATYSLEIGKGGTR